MKPVVDIEGPYARRPALWEREGFWSALECASWAGIGAYLPIQIGLFLSDWRLWGLLALITLASLSRGMWTQVRARTRA